MVALTWKAARLILRQILVEYLDGPSPKIESTVPTGAMQEKKSGLAACIDFWLRNDMDLYAGALILSLALVLLACIAYTAADQDGGSFMNAAAGDAIYQTQLAASIVVGVISVLGIWLVRRRQFACSRDVDSVKRREIKRFLKSMERKEDDKPKNDPQGDAHFLRRDSSTSAAAAINLNTEPLKLPGTSLTDIYPVYRISSEEGGQGSWSRLPTLLLVKGDHVALSVGDIAPAKCKVVMIGTDSTVETAEVEGGNRVSMEYLANQPTMAVPKGRTTLPSGSRKLLELCNSLHIFILLESPLEGFLRRPLGESRPYSVICSPSYLTS